MADPKARRQQLPGAWRGLTLCAAALLGLAAAAARPAAAAASDWAVNPQSQVRLISACLVAKRQGELRLGIEFKLAPAWHVYWKNSGDAGFAPVVTFGKVGGLSNAEMLWPAPHRFDLAGGLVAFGYQGQAVYPVRATLLGGARQIHLTADVDYLVCQVDCVPHRYTLALDQPLGDGAVADPATAPLLERWWNQVPLAADRLPGVTATGAITTGGTAATASGPGAASPLQLAIRLDGVSVAPGGADIFFETQQAFEVGRPRVRSTARGVIFEAPLARANSSAPLPRSAALAWTATGLMRDGRPLALTASQDLPIQPQLPTAAAGETPGTAAGGPQTALAAIDPRLVGSAAALATLAALALWGLLRGPDAPRSAAGAVARVGQDAAGAPAAGRVALGFVALLLTLGLLYTLSLEVSAERLAGTELALLGVALLAWLRRRGAFRMRRSQP